MTKAEAQEQLTASLAALTAAREGSYSAGEFSSTPPTIEEAQAQVDHWQRVVNKLSATKTNVLGRRGVWIG